MRPIIAARILLVLASLLAVYLLYRDYGITYDEPVQSTYGDLVREYFLSGGVDRRSEEFLNLRYYGPLTDLLPAFVHPANDLTKYEVRHFLCGLFAVLTLVATWSFARLMPGSLVAPFAFLGLALMPRFAGHAFDNLKDVPFASAIAVFVAVAASMNLKRDFRLSRVIACGLAAGFVLCVRPGGFLLMLGILVAFSFLADLTLGPGPRSRPGSLTVRLVIIIAIGWLLMVLPWPYAHRGPLWHPLEAMALSLSFPWTTDVLFDGAVVRSVDLPRTYLVRMFLITTPPSVLLLALVGLGRMVRTQVAEPRSTAACVYGMAEVWLLIPLLLMAILRPNLYDGIRHVLFVLPALAVVAAVGASTLVELVSGWRRHLAVAAVLLLVATPSVELVRLHPYQRTYFNALVGGLAGAEGRFETDYWVSSYKEAFEWVNTCARRDLARTFHVLLAGTSYLAPLGELYRASNVTTSVVEKIGKEQSLPPGVDYCIATSRWGYAKRLFPEAPVVHSIGRDGAVFTVIRGRSDRDL